MIRITPGATDQSIYVHLSDDADGTDATGLVAADLTIHYQRGNGSKTSVSASDLASLTATHADGGVYEAGAGMYRIDLPDAAFAAGVDRGRVYVAAADCVQTGGAAEYQLDAIPNVTSGVVEANVTQISGDSTAADNLEAAADGTGYNLGNGQIVAASVTGAVGSVTTVSDKTGYALTSGERETLAAVIEAALVNDGDATALLQAIADKFTDEYDIEDLTLAAIASAVWGNGTRTLTAGTKDSEIDAIKAVTDALPDAGALSSLATAAALATVDSNVDAILEDTGTTLPAAITAAAESVIDHGDGEGDWGATGEGGGGGGDATAENQTTIISKLDEIIEDIASVGGVPGSGADSCTLTFTLNDGNTPIADADVWITTDAAGNSVVAGTLQTNSQGKVTFLLDAGNTYYAWLQKDGVNPILGQAFQAEADA